MIRVVALPKAIVAGLCGAAAMELFSTAAAHSGIRTVDFVSELSSIALSRWPLIAGAAGFGVHLATGVCWAVFYAFFFWGRFHLRPVFQGLLFAFIPATLAIFVVYPELALMKLPVSSVTLDVQSFLAPLTWETVASLLVSHALFGLTIGAIYRRPVGYRIGRRPAPPRPRRRPSGQRRREEHAGFMFATGTECSYPTIDQGRWRCDEMDSARHYEFWQKDLELARAIGVTHIRYGPPLHLVYEGPGRFDWDYVDPQMQELRDFGPEPIVDLCHFGVPDWLENFQNPDLGGALAEYAGAFAERFPWVRFYTPVNEMYVSARMSALDGLWNEQLENEGAYVRAAWNLADASIRMSDAILERREDAVFINSESSEFYQPCCPDPEIGRIADEANQRRFLPLDLIFAHPLSDEMHDQLCAQGISRNDIDRIGRREVPRRSILGVDYYEWNERLIDRDGCAQALGELFGWYVIADQYWQRYRRPMMHTETNKADSAGAARWLWRQWHNVQLLAKAGVPLVGFTWYSLVDQIDWSIAMSDSIGLVDPVGLFDLNREPRVVGLAYKHLIDMYRSQPAYRECEPLKAIMQ
ncbi:MAG TPA: family 1 glycosylhydrolase [Sphingomicrobium sp.]|jgi:beta-glucosidase/6-phospho-beta-glucosidase/beta-galactosidase